MRERAWPTAPELPHNTDVFYRTASYPALGRYRPSAGLSGPRVVKLYEGRWLYLVPPELWDTVPTQVRTALTALYDAGFRSVPQIAAADVDDLMVEGLRSGGKRFTMLQKWLDWLAFGQWRDGALAAIEAL